MGNVNNDLGIKTAVSLREAKVLRMLAAGKRVLEVGSLLGYSTIQMARTAERVDAIDPHDGYPYYNPVPTLPCFLRNIARWGVDHKVHVRVGYAQAWLPVLHGDFTFIDCTGFYEDTKFCIEAGKGTIAVHDFGRRGCEGVGKAVMEFYHNNPHTLEVVDTLAILHLPDYYARQVGWNSWTQVRESGGILPSQMNLLHGKYR